MKAEFEAISPAEVIVRTGVVPTNEDWPEPKKIKQELLPVNSLPLSIVPKPYQAWIKDASNRMQCPPDFLAVASIVMTGSIIGAGCGIKPKQKDDWIVIPNLWGGGVGRPGIVLKNPAIN